MGGRLSEVKRIGSTERKIIMNIQQLRAQIAALQDATLDENKNFRTAYDEGKFDALTAIDALLDSLQEEPVSDELEEAANDYAHDLLHDDVFETFIAGAQWQKEHLWKPADGDDLPDIDREVIVLYQPYPCEGNEYAVSFAHRPKEYWEGRNIKTDEVTRYYPKRYDKGGWNSPDVKFWLDCNIEKLINNEEDDKR